MEKKMSYEKLARLFAKANEEGKVLYGVIVYSQDNWGTEYSLESRSYATVSNQRGWDTSKEGRCRQGYSLDGSDSCRLDLYRWKVDYCYLITEAEFNKVMEKF